MGGKAACLCRFYYISTHISEVGDYLVGYIEYIPSRLAECMDKTLLMLAIPHHLIW